MTMTVLDRAIRAGDAGGVTRDQERPDPEVPQKARRRTFTAAYKQEVLAAYEAAADGEKGAILRREGLYSSLISEWRRARDAGSLAGLEQPRGRPTADPRDAQIARLRKENAEQEQEQELAKARFVAGVQTEPQALLETISEGADTEPRSST
jgi:transposase-like protein